MSATDARAARDSKTLHVLLVDDHVQLRRLLCMTLAGEGFEVTQADSADRALEILQGGLRPDMLVSDVRVPGRINGLQLARAAKRLLPSIAVLLQTGYTDLTVTEFPVLRKPYNPAELAEALRRVLAQVGADFSGR
jgi:CheY-like chemotaxis protein